jgi:hypothetical protein
VIVSDGFARGVGMKVSQFNVDTFSNKSHVRDRLLYIFNVERLVSQTQFNSTLLLALSLMAIINRSWHQLVIVPLYTQDENYHAYPPENWKAPLP